MTAPRERFTIRESEPRDNSPFRAGADPPASIRRSVREPARPFNPPSNNALDDEGFRIERTSERTSRSGTSGMISEAIGDVDR